MNGKRLTKDAIQGAGLTNGELAKIMDVRKEVVSRMLADPARVARPQHTPAAVLALLYLCQYVNREVLDELVSGAHLR